MDGWRILSEMEIIEMNCIILHITISFDRHIIRMNTALDKSKCLKLCPQKLFKHKHKERK